MYSTSQISQTNSASLSLEQSLVFQAQQNSRAFRSLYESHYNEVFSFIQKKVSDRLTSAHLTHQVFRKALSEIKKYKLSRVKSYSKYLIGIARLKCTSFLKSRNKKNQRLFHNPSTNEIDSAFSKNEIQALMDFETLWMDPEIPENDIVLPKNIFLELISYIEVQVLRRALVGIGIIVVLGVTMNFFIPDNSTTIKNQTTPADLQEELDTKKNNKAEVVYQEDIACLDL